MVTVVGQPYRPTLAGNGGLSRGLPCTTVPRVQAIRCRGLAPYNKRNSMPFWQSAFVHRTEERKHVTRLLMPTCLPSSDSMSAVSSPQM